MVVLKLSASDVRLMRAAATPAEHASMVELIVRKIDRFEADRKAGIPLKETKLPPFTWKQAYETACSVLGKQNVTMPPFPDATWYQRMARALKLFGITEASMTQLAEYARDHMRLPIQLGFLVGQCERVLAGEWDVKKPRSSPAPPFAPPIPSLPDDLPKGVLGDIPF